MVDGYNHTGYLLKMKQAPVELVFPEPYVTAKTFPNTVSMLQAGEGLTKQDIDNLLGGTAAKFVGLKP
jgi:hypothetical protein